MNKRQKLTRILADGRFHSGGELGKQFGITRAGIWKIIKQIEALGITIHAVTGKGYQIPNGLDLLNADEIRRSLTLSLNKLEILETIDSTNTYLFQLAKTNAKSGHVVIAEKMTAGKGRRGRHWHAPYGRNIYLSILWEFHADPGSLAGLSLALSVAIVRALKQFGINGLNVKWPNDVLINHKKLAGILLEMLAESHDFTKVVAGIGVNVNMQEAVEIDRSWTSIQQIIGKSASRSQIMALLINQINQAFDDFAKTGLESFISEWETFDATRGKLITLELPDKNITGYCEGITQRGELLINTDGRSRAISIGEVSI